MIKLYNFVFHLDVVVFRTCHTVYFYACTFAFVAPPPRCARFPFHYHAFDRFFLFFFSMPFWIEFKMDKNYYAIQPHYARYAWSFFFYTGPINYSDIHTRILITICYIHIYIGVLVKFSMIRFPVRVCTHYFFALRCFVCFHWFSENGQSKIYWRCYCNYAVSLAHKFDAVFILLSSFICCMNHSQPTNTLTCMSVSLRFIDLF